jgi:ATP-dependent HslUV protease ATP-binding subunit HslU
VLSPTLPPYQHQVGPTGCGKTEIARRLATLAGSPFIKVEATKFTEVGFHGRDVETIVRDLLNAAITLVKKSKTEELRPQIESHVRGKILDKLCGGGSSAKAKEDSHTAFDELLQQGKLEDQLITVEVPVKPPSLPGGGNVVSGEVRTWRRFFCARCFISLFCLYFLFRIWR